MQREFAHEIKLMHNRFPGSKPSPFNFVVPGSSLSLAAMTHIFPAEAEYKANTFTDAAIFTANPCANFTTPSFPRPSEPFEALTSIDARLKPELEPGFKPEVCRTSQALRVLSNRGRPNAQGIVLIFRCLSRNACSSEVMMKRESDYSAHNYHPILVVFSRAKDVHVWDPEGHKYLDFLSAYSAVNQGHCHEKILNALAQQVQQLTLSSRAFYNDKFPIFAQHLTGMFGYEMMLPMNTGAEDVETALKLARKWGYEKKHIPNNEERIIGVLDWELSTVGNPMSDVAYNCMPFLINNNVFPVPNYGFENGIIPEGVPSSAEHLANYCAAAIQAQVRKRLKKCCY